MNSLDIATLIASHRHALKLTQAELAGRAKISRRTLIDLEHGSSGDIGFRKLERVLNSLGLSVVVTDQPRRPTESELREIFKDDE